MLRWAEDGSTSNEASCAWRHTRELMVTRIQKPTKNGCVKYRSGKLTTEQINEARATGVRFSPPYHAPKPKPPTGAERREAEMLRKLSLLEDFYRSHGHINVGQLVGTKDWPGAGRWISRIRALNRRGKLPQSVVRAAEEMNLDWNLGTGR